MKCSQWINSFHLRQIKKSFFFQEKKRIYSSQDLMNNNYYFFKSNELEQNKSIRTNSFIKKVLSFSTYNNTCFIILLGDIYLFSIFVLLCFCLPNCSIVMRPYYTTLQAFSLIYHFSFPFWKQVNEWISKWLKAWYSTPWNDTFFFFWHFSFAQNNDFTLSQFFCQHKIFLLKISKIHQKKFPLTNYWNINDFLSSQIETQKEITSHL